MPRRDKVQPPGGKFLTSLLGIEPMLQSDKFERRSPKPKKEKKPPSSRRGRPNTFIGVVHQTMENLQGNDSERVSLVPVAAFE